MASDNGEHKYQPGDRAAWQRGPGVRVFGELALRCLPHVMSSADDGVLQHTLHSTRNNRDTLVVKLRERGNHTAAESMAALLTAADLLQHLEQNGESLAHLIAQTTDANVAANVSGNQKNAGSSFREHCNDLTFFQVPPVVLAEGFLAQTRFPINILASAVLWLPDDSPPILRGLEDLPGILRSGWFRKMASAAAAGINGTWGGFSTKHLGDFTQTPAGERTLMHRQSVKYVLGLGQIMLTRFTFGADETHGLSTVHFAPEVIEAIKQMRLHNNKAVAAHFHDGQSIETNAAETRSSSGCIANHTRPIYASDAAIHEAADALQISTDQAQSGFDRSIIDSYLEGMARFFEHVISL